MQIRIDFIVPPIVATVATNYAHLRNCQADNQ